MTLRTRFLARAGGLASLVFFAALLSAGCSGDSAKGTVSGKVTVGGKILKSGQITFEPQSGKRDPSSTKIINGEYTTGEMGVGVAKISIVPSLESAQGDEPPQESAHGDLRPAPKKKSDLLKINSKYQNAETSGLTFDVQKGPNKKDFDIDP